ncbi:hypothetical protein ACNFJ7_10925 [Sphingomonas sp. HT-1]|uniref:hypothetical protein n=1 Tax=unclassified Sphingomonas TaxID=196159 RepID=UPI00031AC815|nr:MULTISPECIES: hypothetical protein [unclassified Sphingomonas]KTF70331.1 hypothetical protein ATB93_04740 [Sphingomonas sp. WG]
MSLDSLRHLTRDILQMMEEILRSGEPPIDVEQLAALRKRVALAHSRFFVVQEQAVLQPLRRSSDPALAALARYCVERDLEGRHLGLAHHQRWPLARIAEDPAGYRRDVRRFLRWLEGRVQFAEESAYPALAKIISSPGQRSAD